MFTYKPQKMPPLHRLLVGFPNGWQHCHVKWQFKFYVLEKDQPPFWSREASIRHT